MAKGWRSRPFKLLRIVIKLIEKLPVVDNSSMQNDLLNCSSVPNCFVRLLDEKYIVQNMFDKNYRASKNGRT